MKKILLLSYFLLIISYLSFSQNVGIGTATPTRAKLELNGAADATTAIFGGELTGISLQRSWPGIGFNTYWNAGDKYIANGVGAKQHFDPGSGYMYFDMFGSGVGNGNITSQVRALTISNTGNIGLRAAPINASLFAIKAGNYDGAAVFGGTSHNSYFNYGVDEHTYIRPGKNGSYVYINDIPGNKIVLGGGNAVVGINASNPASTLEISQVNNKGLVLVDPLFDFNYWEYRVDHWVSAPESHLRLFYNGATVGAFFPTGGYGATPSDRRIKTSIKPLPAVLDKINLLQPSVYEMKDHNDNHEKTVGFIAQDIKPLFPELITVKQVKVDTVNKIPDLHAIDYTSFSVVAVKALQEQYEQIKALEKRNAELMKRLDALDKKIAAGKSIEK